MGDACSPVVRPSYLVFGPAPYMQRASSVPSMIADAVFGHPATRSWSLARPVILSDRIVELDLDSWASMLACVDCV